MKLLFVMPYMRYSGAPKMMATVANWFAESGDDVTVCTFFKAEVTQNLNPKIKLENLGIERGGNKIYNLTLGYIKTEKKIYDYIKKQKADAVISFGDMFSLGLFKKLNKDGQCVIVSERADPSGTGFFAKHRKKTFGFANGFVFQTEGAKACFSEDIQKRGFVIPNSINRSEVEVVPFADRKKKIVCVGRFELKQKRQDVLIKAFEIFYEKHPEYELVFYGDGEDMQASKAMADSSKASKNIMFPGAVKPIEQYIKDASMLVMPSDYEGIPNAIIEAMNMEIPVVSTDCRPGGARMLLGENEYGRVVPIGDFEGLAREMCYVADNYEVAKETAKKAKISLDRFEESKISQMWKDAINTIVK